MSTRPAAATERLSRVLTRLLPRRARADFGEPMVQLAKDRRRYDDEPIWRLWPSLVVDAVSTAARSHREESMPRIPAVFIGLVFAIAVFAVLSASPAIGLVLAAVGGLLLRTQHGRIAPRSGRTRHGAWALAGAGLVATFFTTLAWQGDDELSAPAWLALVLTLITGLTALGTAAVLAFERRSSPPAAA